MSSLLGDYFLAKKLFRLSVYFVRCRPLLLIPQNFSHNIYFSNPSALLLWPTNFSCLFLMVLTWDLSYPAISITSSFHFFSVHDILIFLLMYHIFCCFKSSFEVFCLCSAFRAMQKDEPYLGFQNVDFGAKSQISVGNDGLDLGEYVFRQNFFFYFCVWSCCAAQVFKGANLFHSIPLV